MSAFVFDAYGTLFDVHAAIARHRDACGPDAARLSELWRVKQLEYAWTLTLAGRYADFWTLTEQALDHALARIGTVPLALKPKLLEAYLTLDAYPDARAALGGLKAQGARTAILSNGSPAMLAAAVAGADLGGVLDAVISVDAVRMYKPRPEIYALATAALNTTAGETTFVSSNWWDVMGAASFGMRTIWVNRANLPDEYPDVAPGAVIGDLSALLTP